MNTRSFTALSLMILMSFFACKKGDEKITGSDSLATKYAKFRIAVYTDTSLDKKAWLATLEKGEPVELLGEEKVIINKKDTMLSKIKLSDDKIGYTNSDYLAIKPVVFIDNNVKVYTRNNINSSPIATIPAGTIGFVIEEKADWIMVDIGNVNGKWVNKCWVKGGTNDSSEVVADAVSLEKSRNILSETVKGDKEEAMNQLRSLSQKSNQIGEIARTELAKIEGTSQPENNQGESTTNNEGENQ
jgi:lipoprotein LenA